MHLSDHTMSVVLVQESWRGICLFFINKVPSRRHVLNVKETWKYCRSVATGEAADRIIFRTAVYSGSNSDGGVQGLAVYRFVGGFHRHRIQQSVTAHAYRTEDRIFATRTSASGPNPKGLSTAHELNWTPVRELQCKQPHWNTCAENKPITNRSSFAAANQLDDAV